MHHLRQAAASPGALLASYRLSRGSSGPSSSNRDDLFVGNRLFPASPCPNLAGPGLPRAPLQPGTAGPDGAAGGTGGRGVQPLSPPNPEQEFGSKSVPCVPSPPGPCGGALPGPGAAPR